MNFKVSMNCHQSETLPRCASSNRRHRTDVNYLIRALFNRTCFHHQMALVVLLPPLPLSYFHQTSKCRLFFSTLSPFTIHKMPFTIVGEGCAVKTAMMWGNNRLQAGGGLRARGHFEANFGLVVRRVPERRNL